MIFENKKYYGYYKKNPKQVLKSISVVISIMFLFFYVIYVDKLENKNIYLTLIGLIAITFLYDMYWFSYKKNNNKYYMTSTSKKSLNKFLKLITFSYFIIGIMFFLSFFYDIEYNLFSIFFIITIGLAYIYYELMVVGFFDEYYISGQYKIFYDEIDNLVELKRVNTLSGNVIYFKLFKEDKTIGYDKMMENDYLLLKIKIKDIYNNTYC